MAAPLSSPFTAEVLVEGLSRLADVVRVPLRDSVARLRLGRRPVLELDVDSPPDDQCWALLEAIHVLTFGPAAAPAARVVRRLHSVS